MSGPYRARGVIRHRHPRPLKGVGWFGVHNMLYYFCTTIARPGTLEGPRTLTDQSEDITSTGYCVTGLSHPTPVLYIPNLLCSSEQPLDPTYWCPLLAAP